MVVLVICCGLWLLVGMIVVEACRLWRAWWIDPLDLPTILFWPLVLFLTIRNGADQ